MEMQAEDFFPGYPIEIDFPSPLGKILSFLDL